jgi:hypothetical protein
LEVTDINDDFALVFIAPLFFGISFIYSSVGFGGGSSYIAILVLLGISLFAVPPVAQILNIIVAGMAVISFAKAKHLSLKFTLPFLSSVPFAFFAGTIALPEWHIALIFVLALFAASAALFLSGIRGRFEKVEEKGQGIEAVGYSENIINWGSHRSYPRCCRRTCRYRGRDMAFPTAHTFWDS